MATIYSRGTFRFPLLQYYTYNIVRHAWLSSRCPCAACDRAGMSEWMCACVCMPLTVGPSRRTSMRACACVHACVYTCVREWSGKIIKCLMNGRCMMMFTGCLLASTSKSNVHYTFALMWLSLMCSLEKKRAAYEGKWMVNIHEPEVTPSGLQRPCAAQFCYIIWFI